MRRKGIKDATKNGKAEFTAYVARYGRPRHKKDFGDPDERITILLTDVRDSSGRLIADHLWSGEGEKFLDVGIHPCDRVSFLSGCASYSHPHCKGKSYRLDGIEGITLRERNGEVFTPLASVIVLTASELGLMGPSWGDPRRVRATEIRN